MRITYIKRQQDGYCYSRGSFFFVLILTLQTLDTILKVGESFASGGNPFVKQLEESKGLAKLEAIQQHKNERIYNKVTQLLTYFGIGEEDDDSSTEEDGEEEYSHAPQTSSATQAQPRQQSTPFQFQFPAQPSAAPSQFTPGTGFSFPSAPNQQ